MKGFWPVLDTAETSKRRGNAPDIRSYQEAEMTDTAERFVALQATGRLQHHLLTLLSGTVFAMLAAQGAYAETVVVENGETVNALVELDQDGDKLVVQAGGTVDVAGADAVDSNGGGANVNISIENSGTIHSDATVGINVYNGSNIANLGNAAGAEITGNLYGIYVDGSGDISSLTNAGLISGSGAFSSGIVLFGGDFNNLNNLSGGTISGDAYGIYMAGIGSLNNAVNAGVISGANDDGIHVEGGGNITNLTNLAGGQILGGDAGIRIMDGGDLLSSGNAGLVDGHLFGIRLQGGGDIFGFTNTRSGILRGLNAGVLVSDGGSVVDFTNAGRIETDGGISSVAIGISGDLTRFTNTETGVVSNENNSTTFSLRGIDVAGAITDMQNDGFIVVEDYSAGNASALVAGDLVSLTNSGTIQASSAGAANQSFGLGADNRIWSLTNSGRIIVDLDIGDPVNSGYAIGEGGGGDTVLTLLPGSIIVGNIGIEGLGGGNDTLVVGSGLNLASTFAGVGSVDEIVAPGALVTRTAAGVYGDLIVVADTSSLAAEDNALSDTTKAISGVLSAELDKNQAMPARNLWAKGFGSAARRRGAANAPANIRFGGLMTGADAILGETRLGLFGGVSAGGIGVAVENGQTIDTKSYFGGAYGRYETGSYHVDFAFTGGIVANDSTRIVANNFVQSGLETATASYNSYFLAPEITVGTETGFGRYGLKPSATLRYGFVRSGGYTETGLTNGNLEVGARTSHVLDARLQVAMPVETRMRDAELVFQGRRGRASCPGRRHLRRHQMGETFTAFDPGGDRLSAGAFAGFDFSRQLNDTASLFASAEFGTGSETAIRANAEIGVKVGF
jgi:hypothetical protein